MRLKNALGWNQTEADWLRLLQLEPEGCFVACAKGQLVGTVTAIAYGTDLAWIGMMLVDPAFRRRGIGASLMRACMAYLHAKGVRTVKLDATPAGRPLYESLGFVPELTIERWEGRAVDRAATGVGPITDRASLFALDRHAFGVDRSHVLQTLLADAPALGVLDVAGNLQGYALRRRGSRAAYIGPIVAQNSETALLLLDAQLSAHSGETLFIDFHPGAANSSCLAERGFTKQRDLTRMHFGEPSPAGTNPMVFAIAGPEVG